MIFSKKIFIVFVLISNFVIAQNTQNHKSLYSMTIGEGVKISFDEPEVINSKKSTIIVLYALPNGNTTEQTFGKIIGENEDWHFNIQHIGAQTKFIRKIDTTKNYIVAYLENELKSWPAWKRKCANSGDLITKIVATVWDKYKTPKSKIILACHSGGGSFIFGYLNENEKIPIYIDRIGFLDATYGYETDLHLKKISKWLKNKKHILETISYNDSVVVYNEKPLVSPKGGTWYRSKLMANDLAKSYKITKNEDAEKMIWNGRNIEFIFVKNPNAKILHTVLVEKNGFIHLILKGTKYEEKGYKFWSDRVYQGYILNSL